jgi:peptidoglycan hydrolase CwlO-like protein
MADEDVVRLQEQMKTLFGDFKEIKGEIAQLKEEIQALREKFSQRPPVWATALISVLTAAVAWFAKG